MKEKGKRKKTKKAAIRVRPDYCVADESVGLKEREEQGRKTRWLQGPRRELGVSIEKKRRGPCSSCALSRRAPKRGNISHEEVRGGGGGED